MSKGRVQERLPFLYGEKRYLSEQIKNAEAGGWGNHPGLYGIRGQLAYTLAQIAELEAK